MFLDISKNNGKYAQVTSFTWAATSPRSSSSSTTRTSRLEYIFTDIDIYYKSESHSQSYIIVIYYIEYQGQATYLPTFGHTICPRSLI